MDKSQKEQVVADLVTRLRETESLIVADYRGLTNAQLVDLRTKLRGSGARLTVVKNTLTRRAAGRNHRTGLGLRLGCAAAPAGTAQISVQSRYRSPAAATPASSRAACASRAVSRPW